MEVLRRHVSPLATYVVLANAVSWVLWAPVVLVFPDAAAPPWWALVLAFAGAYGPSMAAIATAAIHGGRGELDALFANFSRWRVGWPWYVLALLGPPAFVWLGAGIHMALGGTAGVSRSGWPFSAALILAAHIPFGPLGEELGWRGYALPRLEARLSPLASSARKTLKDALLKVPDVGEDPDFERSRDLGDAATDEHPVVPKLGSRIAARFWTIGLTRDLPELRGRSARRPGRSTR